MHFRALYWYEEGTHPDFGVLMTSKTDGSNVKTFFNNTDEDVSSSDFQDECNCPDNPQIAKSFIIDLTSDNLELYWIDPWANRIIVSDGQGCSCRNVIDATEKRKYGFPPMSMTVDSKYIYWYNSTEKNIYYTNKLKKNKIEQIKTSFGYKIMALDPANQPYPPRPCLFPVLQEVYPTVSSYSANSITLRMPPVSKPSKCQKIVYDMTATEFTVFYGLHMNNDTTKCDRESCSYITTTSNEVVLSNLKPFTTYSVHLEATNYYAKLHEVRPIVGATVILQTAAEGIIYIYYFEHSLVTKDRTLSALLLQYWFSATIRDIKNCRSP